MVEDVAHTGAKTVAGGYIIGIAEEEAEGMYHPNGEGKLEWVEPRRQELPYRGGGV